MTIMLLPEGKVLFLFDQQMTEDQAEMLARFAREFVKGPDPTIGIVKGVSQIIDARVEPAIAIAVPQ